LFDRIGADRFAVLFRKLRRINSLGEERRDGSSRPISLAIFDRFFFIVGASDGARRFCPFPLRPL
jgi:hypothetical protein